jgi:serine/threonine protein kinase
MSYTFVKHKGRGGFGSVDIYRDDNGNEFAVKTFDIDPRMKTIEEQARKRFINEAKYQQLIDHPNIVKIIDIETDKEPPRYTMPLADASLQDDIANGVFKSTDDFLQCFYDIMAGLEEMHSLSIYHRDLKPGNVLRFGKRYAIGDFGLMSIDQTGVTSLTTTGMTKTSDFYTAPEITQDLKRASIQSDIYSLGCILHDFIGQAKRIPCNEISESSEYGDVLLGATRMDPSRRFSDVASFREALNSITQNTESVKTQQAEKVLATLKKDFSGYDEQDISLLSDFLSSNVVQEEKNIILHELSINHILKIVETPKHFNYIGKIFCQFVRDNSFEWGFCDTLANRIVVFIDNGNIDIKSDGIFALLYMSTRHNRWYAERIVLNYLQKSSIEGRLLKRMVMEMRIDGKRFCWAINHLHESLGANKDSLHPEIKNAIDVIC